MLEWGGGGGSGGLEWRNSGVGMEEFRVLEEGC